MFTVYIYWYHLMSYYNKKKTFVYKTITSLCKEVSVPTAAGTLIKLEQSSLHEPENKGVINRLKSFFGVRKTVRKMFTVYIYWYHLMSYYNKKKTFVYKTITSLCSGSTFSWHVLFRATKFI
jgi:hypothetical protein